LGKNLFVITTGALTSAKPPIAKKTANCGRNDKSDENEKTTNNQNKKQPI
jgi:hypothetical protein